MWHWEQQNAAHTRRKGYKSVKTIVVHCGTNNIHRNTSVQIANSILWVVCLLKKKLPEANILTTGIFPREDRFSKSWIMVPKLNEQLKHLCSRKKLFLFLEPQYDWFRRSGDLNKKISAEMNYTFLNLNKGNVL